MLLLGATQSLVVGGAAASSRVQTVSMQWDPFWRSNAKTPAASDAPAPITSSRENAAAPEAAGPWSNSWRSAASGRNAAAPEGTPVAPAPQPVAAAPSLDAIALQRLREENERLRGELDASRELEALRLTELAAMTARRRRRRRRRRARAARAVTEAAAVAAAAQAEEAARHAAAAAAAAVEAVRSLRAGVPEPAPEAEQQGVVVPTNLAAALPDADNLVEELKASMAKDIMVKNSELRAQYDEMSVEELVEAALDFAI